MPKNDTILILKHFRFADARSIEIAIITIKKKKKYVIKLIKQNYN